ncbi:hypothetical protein Lqui_1944 [Legionella quinlivanii]|uniref:ATP-grasp domain-containing protein n=1 Tax=Legionella quinlivanii TaxID=45073 RepID=A0A0W0XYU0_9GAMM|nr:hypothetical protein [Legionella quinlivanii]KTD49733.1 hypothetical protein Lqui_1944 [Legionella quinlivanii]SEG23584.1 Glutathione synthase/RimK-type ligase, ATP-grasp superfamily [Legionella quinlivanii DSM 21216]STY09898.1 ATP-grasp ribosomal peptide maturase, SAV_5884 family [Legionella quinlivanii]
MKFLIPTDLNDTHTLFVKFALERINHEVRLLYPADYPTRQTNSVYIKKGEYEWRCSDSYESVLNNHYDVVWWRGIRTFIPREALHADDYEFTLKENALFYDSLFENLNDDAWWVNSKEASNRARSKLLQLKLAQECGLLVPYTLCSNDPLEIRHFVIHNEDKTGVIYKPLTTSCWHEEKQIKMTNPSQVRFLGLPQNKVLQLNPGIYQMEVKKDYEIVVNCYGDFMVAAKLVDRSPEEAALSWQTIAQGRVDAEPYEAPAELQKKLRLLMSRLGLVYGSFSFIRDNEGQYIFNEVHDDRQILWLEECNPEFRILDIFVQFLQAKTTKFKWQPKKFQHSLERYRGQVSSAFTENRDYRLDLNNLPFESMDYVMKITYDKDWWRPYE